MSVSYKYKKRNVMNKFDKIYEEYKNKYTSDIINEDIIKNLFFKMRSFPYFK